MFFEEANIMSTGGGGGGPECIICFNPAGNGLGPFYDAGLNCQAANNHGATNGPAPMHVGCLAQYNYLNNGDRCPYCQSDIGAQDHASVGASFLNADLAGQLGQMNAQTRTDLVASIQGVAAPPPANNPGGGGNPPPPVNDPGGGDEPPPDDPGGGEG
jgi:hypothetical protein